jgi:hypothetical protein
MGAARDYGIIDVLTDHPIPAAADTAYQGAGPTVVVPRGGDVVSTVTLIATDRYRRRRRRSTSHARRRGPAGGSTPS